MSLTTEAIQHIESQQQTNAINQRLIVDGIPMIASDNRLDLHSIEKYCPNRIRFRGNFKTSSVGDFIYYANEQKFADVFIDQDKMTANAIFDLGTIDEPLHQEHQSNLILKPSAAYNKLLSVNGTRFSGKRLIELLEDYHANITVLGKESVIGSEPPVINMAMAILALRNAKVKTQIEKENKIEDFSESSSAFAQIDVQNEDGSNPVYIDWTCKPYQGLKLPLQAPSQNDDENELRTFRVRINTLTNGDKVEYSLRIINLEDHQQVMADSLKEQLIGELKTSFKVRVGAF